MSTALNSFARSPLGARVRSPLGAFKQRSSRTGLLFCCGNFTGRVAMYDSAADDWTSVGSGVPNYPEFLFVHDGLLHAASTLFSGVYVMNAINDWTNVGFTSSVFDAISFGGYITVVDDLDGKVYQLIGSTWTQLGDSPAFKGYLHIDAGYLWAGNSRLEGSTWVHHEEWDRIPGAGTPSFLDYRGRENKPVLVGGGGYGGGFYSFVDSQFEFTEVLPTNHNINGAEAGVSGWVYTGGGSEGWEFNPADSVGTSISINSSDPFRLFTHNGARYIFNNMRLYSGTPPVRAASFIIPLARAEYAISYDGKIIIVGVADSTGAIQEYDGASYAFKGTDNTYPNGVVYHVINAVINLAVHIDSLSSYTASIRGGDVITVTGDNFTAATVILVDGVEASTTYVNPQQLTFTTAAHAAGAVNVSATNGGSNIHTLIAALTFEEIQITAVDPATGDEAGGEPVSIEGRHFASGTDVYFGTELATDIVVVDSENITCTTPANTGIVDVTVEYGAESDSLAEGFEYTAASSITVTSISPSSGSTAGGLSVTVTGTGFTSDCTVIFKLSRTELEEATSITFVNDTEITCSTPAWSYGTGAVDVIVQDTVSLDEGVLVGGFTYT